MSHCQLRQNWATSTWALHGSGWWGKERVRVHICVCARVWWAGRRGQGQIPKPSVLEFPGNAEYLRSPRGRHPCPPPLSAQIQAAGRPPRAPHEPGTGSGRTEVLLSTGSCGPRPSFCPTSSPCPLPRTHWVVWEVCRFRDPLTYRGHGSAQSPQLPRDVEREGEG